MNKLFYVFVVYMMSLGVAQAQPGRQIVDEASLPGKRSELNVRNAIYPRILPDNRVEFKIKAPEARKLQIDLGKKYDIK